jgi:hypothetical protein
MKKFNELQKILGYFTLAKMTSALLTIVIIASLKYYISGSFQIEYDQFFTNVGIGIVG